VTLFRHLLANFTFSGTICVLFDDLAMGFSKPSFYIIRSSLCL
jgi:hypothetical protein